MKTTAPPSQHFLRCPFCMGYKSLDSDRCSTCGARCTGITWETDANAPMTPELVLVSRTYPHYSRRAA